MTSKADIEKFWSPAESSKWFPHQRDDVLAFRPLGRQGAWAVLFLQDDTPTALAIVVLPQPKGPDTDIFLGEVEFEEIETGAAHLRNLILFLRTLDNNHLRVAWLKDTMDAVSVEETDNLLPAHKDAILSMFAQFDSNQPAEE